MTKLVLTILKVEVRDVTLRVAKTTREMKDRISCQEKLIIHRLV